MPYLDSVNCLFEYVSALVIWLSVVQIYKDKTYKGVHISQAVFFSAESIWNLHYYNTLNQPLSLLAGVFVCVGNISWLWLAVSFCKYKKQVYTGLFHSSSSIYKLPPIYFLLKK